MSWCRDALFGVAGKISRSSWRRRVTTGCANMSLNRRLPDERNVMPNEQSVLEIERNKGDFRYDVPAVHDAGIGLNEDTIHFISNVKDDPDWVREFRLNALKTFLSKPMPTHWASKDLEAIVFENIRYYLSGGTQAKRSWDEVPDDVKRTFERLGIPE